MALIGWLVLKHHQRPLGQALRPSAHVVRNLAAARSRNVASPSRRNDNRRPHPAEDYTHAESQTCASGVCIDKLPPQLHPSRHLSFTAAAIPLMKPVLRLLTPCTQPRRQQHLPDHQERFRDPRALHLTTSPSGCLTLADVTEEALGRLRASVTPTRCAALRSPRSRTFGAGHGCKLPISSTRWSPSLITLGWP